MFGRRRGGTIGLVGAQQLLGVGGALTLANILKDLIFWADLLKAVLEGWAEIVQVWLWPVGEFLFGWAFALLRIELTPFWKDYLTIGLLFGAGFARHFVLVLRRIHEEGEVEAEPSRRFTVPFPIPFPIHMSRTLKWVPLLLALLAVPAWPLSLMLFAGLMLASREDWRFVAYGLVSVLLPLIYLGLLIAFNELVLT
jgi:hypothetical protein